MSLRAAALFPSLILASALVLAANDARAFCRTTTCDPSKRDTICSKDRHDCVTSGHPLFWRGRCLSFGVHKDGSRKRKIGYEVALATIKTAYVQWLNADCNGEHPSLQMFVSDDPIECGRQEYNQDEPNANAWIFRDESWPHPASAHQLALTTISYFPDDGEIYDVDVEINTFQNEITVGDRNIKGDLASIAAHEAGHFFGLSHTNVTGATMTPSYEFGQTALRDLEPDDIAGICSVYPPNRRTPSCEVTRIPRHGFSTQCGTPGIQEDGCTVSASPSDSSGARALGAGLIAGLLLVWRRPRHGSGR